MRELRLILSLFILVGFAQCKDENNPTVLETQTIIDLVSASPNLSIFVSALQRTNLTSALQTNDTRTVLAPNNNAFINFLNANDYDSLEDVPVNVLSSILLNHVLTGEREFDDFFTGYQATLARSASSQDFLSLYVNTASNRVLFNGISNIITPDIEADNGIIHIVDQVIKLPTIVDHVLANPDFGVLREALTRQDLTTNFISQLSTPAITSPAPFTVLAPTNNAFGGLFGELGINNLSQIDEPTLNSTLQSHVIDGTNITSSELSDNQVLPTLAGNITANITNGIYSVTDSNGRVCNIAELNIQADNGVIHSIIRVVLP